MPRRAVKKVFASFVVSNSGVSVSAVATSIPVVSATNAPTGGPFTIRNALSGEVIRVNGVSGNVFTPCTRGLPEGNAAATIGDGAILDEIWGAQDIADVEDYQPPIDTASITSGTLAPARLPLATTGAFGAVKPDGSTITVSGGVISSAGGGGGSGTVTSVALSLPADFTVSGSPITTAGTLTVTRNTESANTVLVGPATGSPASPTYRLLVGADLPAATTGTQGAVTLANSMPIVDGTGTIGSSTAAARADHVHPLTTAFTAEVTVPDLKVNGLTGSVQAMRVVGATSSGAPVTGAHLVGDASLSLADGKWYVCTGAGTPGTFVSAAGSGTVTSVGLTVPGALLSVSGSPVTSNGTLAVSLATQSANTVLAGPSSGSPATPTMRALVTADVSAIAATLAPAPSGDTSGATDNAALQAILTGFSTTGGTLRLQAGTYYITGLTTSGPCTIQGQGPMDSYLTGAVTTVICPSATAVAITVGAPTFTASNFFLKNGAGSTPTAGAGILFSAAHSARSARLSDLTVSGFYVDVDFVNGGEWFMDRCTIMDPVLYGVRVLDTEFVDGGDMTICNSQIYSGPNNTGASALVRYESGGGMRFLNNKLNMRGSAQATYGFEMAVVDGANTGDLLMVGNSLENAATAQVRLHLKGGSNTGLFRNIVVVGNELSTAGTCLLINPEAAARLKAIIISGNAFADGSTGISLSNVDNIAIGSNTYTGVATSINVGSGVTNLVQAATNANATTGADGLVKVDNNSSGDPVAITQAGYLSSITALTHSNLSASAGVTLSQLGQSSATTGQVPTWSGSAWAAATPSGGTPTTHSESLTDGSSNLIFAKGDVVSVVGVPN